MSEIKVYPVPESILQNTHIKKSKYDEMYKASIETPDVFWAEQAEDFLTWSKPWSEVREFDFKKGETSWFKDGTLNVSVNCIDRHLEKRGDQVAIIWEGDDPEDSTEITYRELHENVCKLANGLRARGVKKGDRVCIYMPMILEASYAMLACARIGAVHSVVFGGFSPEALKDRINNCECATVITADEGVRGGKTIPLKANVDKALEGCEGVETVIVVERTGNAVSWDDSTNVWYHDLVAEQPADCEPE